MIINWLRVFPWVYRSGVPCAIENLYVCEVNIDNVMIKEHVVGDYVTAYLRDENRNLWELMMHIQYWDALSVDL